MRTRKTPLYLLFGLFTLVLVMTLLWLPSLCNASPVRITPTTSQADIKDGVMVYVDSKGTATLEDIQRKPADAFTPYRKAKLNPGYSKNVYWMVWNFENPSRQTVPIYVEAAHPWINRLDLYTFNSRAKHELTGLDYPFSTRSVPYRTFVFLEQVPPGQTRCFLRIQSIYPLDLSMSIASPDTFYRVNQNEITWFWAVYAFLFFMVFYNAILSYTLRDRLYLIYVMFLSSLILLLASIDGLGNQYFWAASPFFTRIAVSVTHFWEAFWLTIITMRLLNTKEQAPLFHRIFRLLPVFYIIVIIVKFIDYDSILGTIGLPIASIASFFFIGISFWLMLKGDKAGRYFVLMFFMTLGAGSLSSMGMQGYAPIFWFSPYLPHLSCLFSAILISLYLADRVNGLRLATEAAESRLLMQNQELQQTQTELQTTLTEAESMNQEVIASRKVLLETNERLSESERYLQALFNNVASGLVVFDMDGNIVQTNPYMSILSGFTAEKLKNKNYREFMHPDDIESNEKSLRRLIDERQQVVRMEKQLLRADGSYYWADMSANLLLDQNGEPSGILLVTVDISERVQEQRERRRLQELLINTFDAMPSVLIAIDLDGMVTNWNQSAAAVTGYSRAEALGKPIESLIPNIHSIYKKVARAIRYQQLFRDERVLIYDNEGKAVYYDITVYPLVSAGSEGAVLRIDEVTERIRMEELMVQTEKMISVGGLAAGMAHEINNPLGGIIQATQNILRRLDPHMDKNIEVANKYAVDLEKMNHYLEERNILLSLNGIQEAGSRAAKIVANMLQFSRRSDNKHHPRNIVDMFENAVELASNDYDLKKSYDFRHITIVREYDTEIQEVTCSENEIEQVLLNLLKNAAQAMGESDGERAPVITLRTYRDGAWAVMQIGDNGPGMDENTRKRIFEPFFTTKEHGKGTGLGLSVSYFIITENHKGQMMVESNPGWGTIFTIRLPMEKE